MNIERRTIRAEVRAPAEGRTFEAVIMRYGVVDDYDTIFDPGCFTRSLGDRLPRITWAHDWSDVIGRAVDFTDDAEKLTIVAELDDFDAVPRARQAYAQLRSGTIDQFSVGFRRRSTVEDEDKRTHFTDNDLDEAACVLSGAVPGTKNLGVRSSMVQLRSGLVVPIDTIVEIARKKAAGELTDEEAAIALDLAAGGDPTTAGPGTNGDGPEILPEAGAVPDLDDLLADAALDALGMTAG